MSTRSRLRCTLAPLLLSGLLLAGCGASDGGGAAVTVGDQTVSVEEFQRELTALRDNPFVGPLLSDQSGRLDPGAVAGQAETVLDGLLLQQRFDEQGLTLAPGARDEVEQAFIAQFSRRFGTNGARVLNAFPVWYQDKLITSTAVSEAVVESFITTDPAAYYAQNKATFDAQCPNPAVLRFIPVETAAQAAQVEAQLNAGTPYLTVLQATVGPDADPAQFDGGCYRRGDVEDPAVDAKLTALSAGQRTVVPIPDGFYVVEAQPLTPATLGPTIARAQRSAAQAAVSAYLLERKLALRPVIDPRFAVVTYTTDESGEAQVEVVAAGASGTPRIRTMPPVTTTPSPLGELGELGGLTDR